MDDTRLQTAKSDLEAALLELAKDEPKDSVVGALIDDARSDIVDLVEGGISAGCSKADLNQLDAARDLINRSLELLGSKAPRKWVYTSMEKFIGASIETLTVVQSGNVVPIGRNRRPNNPGGAA